MHMQTHNHMALVAWLPQPILQHQHSAFHILPPHTLAYMICMQGLGYNANTACVDPADDENAYRSLQV